MKYTPETANQDRKLFDRESTGFAMNTDRNLTQTQTKFPNSFLVVYFHTIIFKLSSYCSIVLGKWYYSQSQKLSALFNIHLSRQITEDDTFPIAFVEGKFYKASSKALPKPLQHDSDLVKSWTQLSQSDRGEYRVSDSKSSFAGRLRLYKYDRHGFSCNPHHDRNSGHSLQSLAAAFPGISQ